MRVRLPARLRSILASCPDSCPATGLTILLGLAFVSPSVASTARVANLDLPYDAFSGVDEEESTEELIFFYGQQFEGDGFFFCLDRSGSSAQGELEIEKRETIRSIAQFSERVQFGVVFYDRGLLTYPQSDRPEKATTARRAAAMQWIATVRPGGGSCVRNGLLRSIGFANRSTAKRNVIIYLGDGGTTCGCVDPAEYARETLAAVARANVKGHEIHAVCVGTDVVDESFCLQLAAIGRGTYKRIQR